MDWEAFFADLEARFDSIAATDVWVDKKERIQAEGIKISLRNRLRGNLGQPVKIMDMQGEMHTGVISEVGADWLVLGDRFRGGRCTVMPLAGMAGLQGLRTRYDDAHEVVNIPLTSVLRKFMDEKRNLRLQVGNKEQAVVITAVGADYIECVGTLDRSTMLYRIQGIIALTTL